MGVLVYLLIFILGAAAGVVFTKRQAPDRRVQELEMLLQDLQARHDRYQSDVSDHFSETAERVNELTQRYREVHQHLIQGAQLLCDDPKRSKDSNPANAFTSINTPEAREPHTYDQYADSELVGYEPPRDYATKSPQDKGTLDERFGFK
jgi:uncharacterized membrane-anchored protein YhcB (DUF1043 family)